MGIKFIGIEIEIAIAIEIDSDPDPDPDYSLFRPERSGDGKREGRFFRRISPAMGGGNNPDSD